ncbi:MAG: DUF2249 domain-containing protein, partial [Acidimicrobiales bacterium]
MTITENEAFEAMLAHHAVLNDQVARRVAAVGTAVTAGDSHGPAAAELVAYLAGDVLPHALAEEHTIYQKAAARPDLAAEVAEMVEEHRRLASSAERLATAPDGSGAAAEAEAIGTLFAAHVAKENEVVLPPLAADDTVDLAALLVQMHRLTEAAQQTTTAADLAALDTESSLLRVLLDAAGKLADGGQGDTACRLVASAWAALRVPRPDLAVRVTAHLHRLVRSVTAQPVDLVVGGAGARGRAGAAGRGLDGEATLDVRSLAPAQRHVKIFATYGALGPGTGFVLVNDHDPKPLRYQFEAEHAGGFTWDYLEAGPEVWRVRIGRPAAGNEAGGDEAGGDPELDVRGFVHGQRHDVIFTSYEALAPGGGFVLVNDHDPKPLRYQFEAQHAGAFSWHYLEAGPGVWRVRIGRPAA